MNITVLTFAQTVLSPEAVRGKKVLEVGAYNVNGSVRPWVVAQEPTSYCGVDLVAQQHYVDEVLPAASLVDRFGAEAFDIVISTEMMEHVEDWRSAVIAMKRVLRVGGLMLISCRSPGFPLHDYPGDYWRFTCHDLRAIFADFEIKHLFSDPAGLGVLFAGRKTPSPEVSIDHINLTSASGLKPGLL